MAKFKINIECSNNFIEWSVNVEKRVEDIEKYLHDVLKNISQLSMDELPNPIVENLADRLIEIEKKSNSQD